MPRVVLLTMYREGVDCRVAGKSGGGAVALVTSRSTTSARRICRPRCRTRIATATSLSTQKPSPWSGRRGARHLPDWPRCRPATPCARRPPACTASRNWCTRPVDHGRPMRRCSAAVSVPSRSAERYAGVCNHHRSSEEPPPARRRRRGGSTLRPVGYHTGQGTCPLERDGSQEAGRDSRGRTYAHGQTYTNKARRCQRGGQNETRQPEVRSIW